MKSSKLIFLKNSGIYFLGDFLSKIITIFLLPVYSKYIVPEDFGYYDLSLSYIMLIIPLLTSEIWVGMMRFIIEEKDKIMVNKIITSGLITIVIPLIFLSAGAIANKYIYDIPYFNLICLLGFMFLIQKYYVFICRSIGSNKIFVISGILNTLVLATSNFYMIVKLGMGVNSLFIASLLGLFTQIIYIEVKIKIRNRLSPKFISLKLLKDLIKFSFPLSLGSLLYFFLMYFNKITIEQVIGLNGNGIYAIAGKFTIVIVFLTSAFTLAWQDMSFSMGDSKENYSQFIKATNLYMKVIFGGSAIMILLLHFVFPLLIDEQYNESYKIIPLSIIATVLATFGNFISQTLGALKNTKIILYSVVISTFLNLLYVKYFVVTFGLNGVNIALIITFLVNILIRVIYLRVNKKMKFNLLLIPFFIVYLGVITLIFNSNNTVNIIIGLLITIVIFYFLLQKELTGLINNIFNKFSVSRGC